MPRHYKAKKDAATCEKPRRDGNNLRPGDLRIGQPNWGNAQLSIAEFIGNEKQTQGSETSQYLLENKTTVISWVAASETETA